MLLIVGTTVLIIITSEPIKQEIQENETLALDLINRDEILIDHNNDFLTFGFPGEGTEDEPFTIENYNITTGSPLIDITDVTKYFVIRNCYLKGINGILIRNSPYVAVIENNYLDVSGYGINLYESGKATIVNNTCQYGSRSILLNHCAQSLIENNTCLDGGDGIYVIYSTNTEIINNYCAKRTRGIYLQYSGNALIVNNTCSNNIGDGIQYENSPSVIVMDNIFNNNYRGILSENSERTIIMNNVCNNNDLEFGIGVVDSPYSQVTNNICNNNTWYSIAVHNSDFTNVTGNSCYDNKVRMSIFSRYCQVTYNHIENTEDYGIEVLRDNNTIHHNNFIGNSLGLSPQGLDDGLNNQWFDSDTLEGNHWDDWIGVGTYSLNGTAGAVDPYPLANPVNIILIPEYETFSLLLILFTSSVILTFNIMKKRKKLYKEN